VAEALLLAERSGVDAAKVREALLGGFAGSKILEVHGQRMLDRTFDPGFRIRLHRKDARIIEGAAAETATPIPSFTAVTEQLQKAVDAGDGERDHSALYAELAREADSPA
jgi:2-hydroxy-3-oxopropionate reductase